MDVVKYLEKKKGGLVEIVKAAGGYALAFKRFDPETGKPQEPKIQPVSIAALESKKAELEAEIADINELMADIKAVK